MSNHINSPQVVGYFGLIVVFGIALILLTVCVHHKLYNRRQRRADNRIFKAAEEARRDFT